MMRFCVFALGIFLFVSVRQVVAQAQIDNSSDKKTTQAHIDSAVDTDDVDHQDSQAKTVTDKWLKSRADELKDILSCYFPPADMDKLIAKQEKDADGGPAGLIKVRIKQIRDLAKNHAQAKYCQ